MFRARESFFAFVDQVAVPVVKGQELPEDHPAVAGREHLFEPVADKPTAPRRRTRKA